MDHPMMQIGETNDPIYGSHQSITVSSVAVPFTTIPAKAKAAHVSVESNEIRWTDDTTTPTTAIGHPAPAGSDFMIVGRNALKKFRMIRTSSDATVKVTFYGVN